MRALVLALDLGSSSVRTALFGTDGRRLLPSTASGKYSIAYSAAGGAELLPSVVLREARRCLGRTLRWQAQSAGRSEIVAVAGSGFWHGLMALDLERKPITPIYTWADSRSTEEAAALRQRWEESEIQRRTGCMIRAPYWPAKLRWLRRASPALYARAAYWLSPPAWIFGELFGQDATSHSMASGTGLYHLQLGTWDPQLCRTCHVRPAQLGQIADQLTVRDSSFSALVGLPLFPALGDGAASNLGSGAEGHDRIAINVGTSAAARRILRHPPRSLPPGLFLHRVDRDRLVLGGATSNAGNLREWLRRELRLPADHDELDRVAATRDHLTVLPFLVRERAPTWPENLHGSIVGLTPATSAAEILRAATTASYYRLADIVDAIDPSRRAVIIVSGGILHSKTALALLADCLGRDLRVARELESSLRGAALHAWQALGFFPTPPRPGRIVRHRPALARLHHPRRAAQRQLEIVLVHGQVPTGSGKKN